MSFGKKGLAAGQTQQAARPARRASPFEQPANRAATAAAQPAAPMSAEQQAFIAAERGRNGQVSSAHGATEYSGPVPSYSGREEAFAKTSFFSQFAAREPSMVVAYILWFFLSNISAHRFYLGAHESALMQIGLLLGSLILGLLIHPAIMVGIVVWALWVLADVFLIPGLHRRRMRGTGYNTGVFA